MSPAPRPLRLLVFDWDGTLRDSIASIVGCALEALADVGLEGDPQAVRATIGLGLDAAVGRWAPGLSRERSLQVIERYAARWISDWHRRAALFCGVPEMLQELDRDGFLLAVATGKSRTGLDRDLAPLEIEHLFSATRTADETVAKPSPQMLFELMEELGARPEETLMIGDTTHDLLMASNAGARAIGVLGGAMEREELLPHAIDCLAHVTEVGGWVRTWNRAAGRSDRASGWEGAPSPPGRGSG